MAINDAIKFLNNLKNNPEFRESLYCCDNPKEMEVFARGKGYIFSQDEVHESYNMMLVKCQIKEQAEVLNEIYNVYRMLLGYAPIFIP